MLSRLLIMDHIFLKESIKEPGHVWYTCGRDRPDALSPHSLLLHREGALESLATWAILLGIREEVVGS